MLDLLSAESAVTAAAGATAKAAQEMRENVGEFLLYGMPKSELESTMLKTFMDADKDDSGSLDRRVCSQAHSPCNDPVAVVTDDALHSQRTNSMLV
jgi:hypothetical protein